MFRIKTRIVGLEDVIRNLNTLEKRIRKKLLRAGTTAMGRIVAKQAKANLKGVRRTGQLKKSIGSKVKTYSNGAVVAIVGPRRGFKTKHTVKPGDDVFYTAKDGTLRKFAAVHPQEIPVDPVHYAHLIELGTEHSKAMPFLRPALDQTRAQCIEKFRQVVADGLAREVAKLPKRSVVL